MLPKRRSLGAGRRNEQACRGCPDRSGLRAHVLMRTQAPGAYTHTLRAAVHLQAVFLDVGQPTCIGMSFRVAYVMAELAYLATNIALGHLSSSLTPGRAFTTICLLS